MAEVVEVRHCLFEAGETVEKVIIPLVGQARLDFLGFARALKVRSWDSMFSKKEKAIWTPTYDRLFLSLSAFTAC